MFKTIWTFGICVLFLGVFCFGYIKKYAYCPRLDNFFLTISFSDDQRKQKKGLQK